MTLQQIQCLLQYLGYYTIRVDGISGPGTEQAVRDFQKAEGLEVIKYFTREEFRCKCGGKYCNGFPAEPQEGMVRAMDNVREHFGRAIIPNSGVRCEVHNANVGGVSTSRHLYGKAVDFRVPGKTAAQVLAYLATLPGLGLCYAIDADNVHMDIE